MALKIDGSTKTYFVRKRHGAPVYEALIRDTETNDLSTTEWDVDELIGIIADLHPDKTTQIPESAVPAPP
ncbi:hypothetical protein [Halococcus saccharolyticus]|uniref:Uncharacterized protein n=1 Tax=Halococcus saccharolyticus DSM 5350 TaxID=1227455 RepID=M0MT26_9EURY|nr:hypothetical protein [Halococcus saccharolyticus]EMA47605.1 hypothetical protein C449_01042 [Halococcus saccharolyticus DSM 5350]